MSEPIGYHHRGAIIGARIYSLFYSLVSSTYDEVSPKIEYWIEYALTEQSVNVDDLVEQLSSMAWDSGGSDADIARFLKEFHDAPHRSEQARSFVDKLGERVLRWFAAASAEGLQVWTGRETNRVARVGGEGFMRAASFVGHLIERGLFSHELVRRHLVKPLIALHYTDNDVTERYFRAMAIYKLFIAAKNTLLQGLLEPEDVQACFKALDAHINTRIGFSHRAALVGPDAAMIKVRCSICPGATYLDLYVNL